MRLLTKEKLSENKYKTEEGYLVCIDAILARTGTQIYAESEIFDSSSNKEIEVMRPANEVFAKKTIASFENKPITIEHPDEFVDTNNYKELSVGFVRDVRRATIENEDFLVGNLIITDVNAISEIEDNGMKYLSCGYTCDVLEKNGEYYQANIRGNHVALCYNPRAGNTKIVDSSEATILRRSVRKIIDCIDRENELTITDKKLNIIKKMLGQIIK